MTNKHGYTLIELVVVVGLVGILSLGLFNLFSSSVRGSQRARLQAEVKSQGDFALASMERQIRNATELPVASGGWSGQSLSFNVPGTNDSQVYSVPTGPMGSSSTITFNGASLFSPPVEVAAVEFEPIEGEGLDPGSVKVSFTLTATEGNLTVSQDFQTTIAIRNIK